MTMDVHERARRLVIADPVEGLSAADQQWLQTHLASCQECRDYGTGLQQALRNIRLAPLAAGASLVQRTQARVAARAAELRRQQEQMRPLWFAAALVCAMSILSVPVVLQMLDWVAARFHVSAALCGAGFLLLWIAPTVVVSLVLLARGTHVGRWQQPLRHYSQEAP